MHSGGQQQPKEGAQVRRPPQVLRVLPDQEGGREQGKASQKYMGPVDPTEPVTPVTYDDGLSAL